MKYPRYYYNERPMITFDDWKEECHSYAKSNGFWDEFYDTIKQDQRKEFAVKLALVVSEIAEVIEELRIPEVDKQKVGEEVGDIFIRLFDLAKAMEVYYKIDIEELMEQKKFSNKERPYKHGKAF